MKKTLALLLSIAAMFSGTLTVTAAEPVPKKNTVTMTIPSSYGYVYDRLTETIGKNDYFYGELIDAEPAPVEEEFVEEEIVMEEPAPLPSNAPLRDTVAMAPVEEAVVEEAPAAPQTGGGSNDYSKTNTQVEGIDEGDIVKTDGKYIYVIKNSEKLVILTANGKDSKVVSTTYFAQKYRGKDGAYYHYNIDEMYLCGNIVAVMSQLEWSENNYRDYYNFSVITFYDVSDHAAPKKVTTLGQEGYLNTSRLIGDTLYVLSNYRVENWQLRQTSRDNPDAYIPHLYKNGAKELVPVNSIVIPPEIENGYYTVITAYDLAKKEIVTTKAIVTPTDTVYMSGENLYLADEYYYEDVLDEYTESVYKVTETVSGRRTTIYKMSLADPAKIVTKAVGKVDGTLLNQFAMDEYRGNLRVVTTHSSSSRKVYVDEKMGFTNTVWKDSQQTNGLYVFDENMDIAGSITGLAEDERVYSVRFTGDVGYFVTYRETDPLFAVDLSDAKNPKIMSALKIPGFSEYLHPYADGLLFGLGKDADGGWTNGVKLSMFDTSNPYDVTEKHKWLTGADSYTAQNNHKAVFVSAKHGLIGFPTEDGYALFSYDAAKGFDRVANIGFDRSWRDSRALYVGENLYIVTRDATVVMDIVNHSILTTVEY